MATIQVKSRHKVHLSTLPPLSLYIHIPWCVRKCPYCDFNSHTLKGSQRVTFQRKIDPETRPQEPSTDLPEAAYLEALTSDLERELPRVWGRRLTTIFFGGGTPSLMSPDTIDQILAMVRARLMVDADAEITLEANPGTVEADRFKGYRAAGVNRLSLGIQSLDDHQLEALGRIHDSAAAARAIAIASATFPTFNVDLMYGLPGQTVAGALADIESALAFAPPHLSAYQLTLEPNTLFYARPPKGLPDNDQAFAMQEAIERRLSRAGYRNYETSAFAQPDHACRHNLNYWRFGDYLGIGAGAAGKISSAERILRTMKQKQPQAYMAAIANREEDRIEVEHREVTADQLPFEFTMNTLRLAEGFTFEAYERLTGQSRLSLQQPLAKGESLGLLAVSHDVVTTTERGRRMLNDVLELFL
jgi:putative oxygen-independent coproporphyrinogen III oxidase